jgi:aminopeptidase 2
MAKEAAREGSVLSLDDRLGLLNDAMALSKAGLAKLSGALTLIDLWRGEKECMSSAPV